MNRTVARGFVPGPFLALFFVLPVRADDESPHARWEPAIRKFEEADAKTPPRKNGVLFVGSSSIRLWDLDKSFPKLDAINRGFGGSEIADSTHFADRIVTKYEPRTIVLYAGDNDIAKGKSAKRVHADFGLFVAKVRMTLPKTKIVFIAVKPSIKRWNLVETVRAANSAIAADCERDPLLAFVDIDRPMIGENGQPKPELFAKDGLHLNAAGYALWTKLVAPHVR